MSVEHLGYYDEHNIRFVAVGACVFRLHATSDEAALLKTDLHLRENVTPFDSQLKPLGELASNVTSYNSLPRRIVDYTDDIQDTDIPVVTDASEQQRASAADLFILNTSHGDVTMLSRSKKPEQTKDVTADKQVQQFPSLLFHEAPARISNPHTETHTTE